jgi:hypothetical protein
MTGVSDLGSARLVTINELVDSKGIAGVELPRNYQLDAPQGVRRRDSDNTLILESSAGSLRRRWRPGWRRLRVSPRR